MIRVVWLYAMASLIATPVFAQRNSSPIHIGDQVRFRIHSVGNSSSGEALCEGQVSRLLLDTVVIRPHGSCGSNAIPPVLVRDLSLEQRKGSRGQHLFNGVVAGLAVGGLAGRLIAGDGCKVRGCDGGLAIIEFTLAGALSGTIVGATIGLLLRAGVHWRPLPQHPARVEHQ